MLVHTGHYLIPGRCQQGFKGVDPLLLLSRCYLRPEPGRERWMGRRELCVEWEKEQRSKKRVKSKAVSMHLVVREEM